jgi:hypothetical protein
LDIGVTLMPVAIACAVVNSALLLGMLALARQAWRMLPPGAPVPAHGGVGGWDRWWPKEKGLLAWCCAGAVIWLICVAVPIFVVAEATSARGGGVASVVFLFPMILLLASEYYALRTARVVARETALEDQAAGLGSSPR